MSTIDSTLLRSCAYYYARGYVPYEEYRAFRRRVVQALVASATLPELPEHWTQEPEPEPPLSMNRVSFPKVPPSALVLSIAALLLALTIALAVTAK